MLAVGERDVTIDAVVYFLGFLLLCSMCATVRG